ncbi:MAG: hypothetical protein HC840_27395 [Leptolyngbyaceae cyanobacterium RM2_2_4]|nr:hypothetical protein [Leptolyngbyaceae cyanobacterium RM2_2_4]
MKRFQGLLEANFLTGDRLSSLVSQLSSGRQKLRTNQSHSQKKLLKEAGTSDFRILHPGQRSQAVELFGVIIDAYSTFGL